MRRLTAISPYKKWHYLDIYPPGYLRTMYRASNIPIPSGNNKLTQNSWKTWSVFKQLDNLTNKKPLSQLSILKENSKINLFCSISLKTNDAAGNPHVICTGINLNDALEMQDYNSNQILEEIYDNCKKSGGTAYLIKKYHNMISQIGIILNISWIIGALDLPVTIIAQAEVEQINKEATAKRKKISWTNQIREEILANKK